jgi:hypothetical protein
MTTSSSGSAPRANLPLRELAAKALGSKAVMLGQAGRIDDEIAVYDALLGRFGAANEPV